MSWQSWCISFWLGTRIMVKRVIWFSHVSEQHMSTLDSAIESLDQTIWGYNQDADPTHDSCVGPMG